MTHRCSDCSSDNCSCSPSYAEVQESIRSNWRRTMDGVPISEIEAYIQTRKQREAEKFQALRAAQEKELRRHEAEVARLKKELGRK